jgi:ATP-dependent helicase/nuclease subunit B
MITKPSLPHVFTISPGINFLATFCHALLNGEVIAGGVDMRDPLMLAQTKIYVPTRRAARALARELHRYSESDAILLPDIVTLGHFEDIEHDVLFAASARDDYELPPSVNPLQRHIQLMQLIFEWAKALRQARLGGELSSTLDLPTFLAIDAPQAWHLAHDLASLMDEMIIEDIDWARVGTLVPDQFDDYWGVTLDFLKIATQQWPNYLAQMGCLDAVTRQKQLVARELKRLEHAAPSPLIALGSTGTNRSTAHLLGAIARAPMGAVVLPGLDLDMDKTAWAMINAQQDGMIAGATHPQAALHRLLSFLNIRREDVRSLGAVHKPISARMRYVQEALRPAESTDVWYHFINARAADQKSHAALDGVALIEARDEREEALCLALKLREVLEVPDATAALITPDRELAQRVKAELRRWQIDIDDSGGDSLLRSELGQLARLVLSSASPDHPLRFLPVLAHNLVCCGHERAAVASHAHIYEIALLRTLMPDHLDMRAQISLARAQAQDRHAHSAKKRMTDRQWDEFTAFMLQFETIYAPLQAMPAQAPVQVWVEEHRKLMAALLEPASWPQHESTLVLEHVWDELSRGAAPDFMISAQDYQSLFEAIATTEIVRGPVRAHPRLKILGLLEARLLHVDVALLAGLDETIWPPHVSTDAFLNRPMRAQLGLSPPERRIGQTAHDFVQLMGSPEVMLTRAHKRNGSPTVPSRFLQRLAAVVGDEVWTQCQKRGAPYQKWAHEIDQPTAQQLVHARSLAARPRPCPALALRPNRLSVTRIETLRRDPYAIYAEAILKLRKLDPLGMESGAREIGIALHHIVAEFARTYTPRPRAEHSAVMRALADEWLRDQLANNVFKTFRWPRYWQALEAFIDWELERRADIRDLWIEQKGAITLTLSDQSLFTLSCEADRIELTDEGLRIIDFKTGRVPSLSQVKAGFAPQLLLEALIIAGHGFEIIRPADVTQALYVKLGGVDVFEPTSIVGKSDHLADLISDHQVGVMVLLNQFRNPTRSYIPRPYPQYVNEFSDYDHLSRVKEWAVVGAGDSE